MFNFSPLCVFKCVLKLRSLEKRHSHTGYICFTFLHCAFLNVSLNGLHENMQSRIGCICLTFLHCVLKAKIIIPKSASSSGNRPPHCLPSFSLRVNILTLKPFMGPHNKQCVKDRKTWEMDALRCIESTSTSDEHRTVIKTLLSKELVMCSCSYEQTLLDLSGIQDLKPILAILKYCYTNERCLFDDWPIDI